MSEFMIECLVKTLHVIGVREIDRREFHLPRKRHTAKSTYNIFCAKSPPIRLCHSPADSCERLHNIVGVVDNYNRWLGFS